MVIFTFELCLFSLFISREILEQKCLQEEKVINKREIFFKDAEEF
jgi:hypothetical protein